VDSRDISYQRRGTRGFSAPELLKREQNDQGIEQPGEFSRSSDIWAIGCILYSVASTGKRKAFSDDVEVMSYSQVLRPCPRITTDFPASFNDELVLPASDRKTTFLEEVNSIIASCLAIQPEGRPTALNLKLRFEAIRARLESADGDPASQLGYNVLDGLSWMDYVLGLSPRFWLSCGYYVPLYQYTHSFIITRHPSDMQFLLPGASQGPLFAGFLAWNQRILDRASIVGFATAFLFQ
jgi:serine/threonine protein kinase